MIGRNGPSRFFSEGRLYFSKPLLVGFEFPFFVCDQVIFVGIVVLQHCDVNVISIFFKKTRNWLGEVGCLGTSAFHSRARLGREHWLELVAPVQSLDI